MTFALFIKVQKTQMTESSHARRIRSKWEVKVEMAEPPISLSQSKHLGKQGHGQKGPKSINAQTAMHMIRSSHLLPYVGVLSCGSPCTQLSILLPRWERSHTD
jgi:hypothetical protein